MKGAILAPALVLLAAGSCPLLPEGLTRSEPDLSCAAAQDCEGLLHAECVGKWTCRHETNADGTLNTAGRCAWECGTQPGCTSDADCGDGHVCKDGQCGAAPTETKCLSSADCKGGERCTAGAEECLSTCEPNTGVWCSAVCAGHCVSSTCAPLECPDLVYCEHGRALDEHGCPTCECNPPPTDTLCYSDGDCKEGQRCTAGEECLSPCDSNNAGACITVCAGHCVARECGPVCTIDCEYGHKLDDNGCPTCECNPPPPEPCVICEGPVPPDGCKYDGCRRADSGECVPNLVCDCNIQCLVYDPVCTVKGTLTCGRAEAECLGLEVLYEGECRQSCDPGQEYMVPGCGTPALPSAGCYTPCESGLACHEGTSCQKVWVDPCAGADCDACGWERGVCLPSPPQQECCFDTIAMQCVDACVTADGGRIVNCSCSAEMCQNCTNTCMCPDVWAPVCGNDLKTYGNECEAKCAGATVRHPGECGKECCPACVNVLPQCGEREKCDPIDGSTSHGECVPANYCDTPRECEGLPHVMCVGKWACERNTCVWYCG